MRVRDDKDLAMAAVWLDPLCFRHAGRALRADKEFVLSKQAQCALFRLGRITIVFVCVCVSGIWGCGNISLRASLPGLDLAEKWQILFKRTINKWSILEGV